MAIDTHAHIFDEAFDLDREEVIKRILENNINKVMIVGFSKSTNFLALSLASQYSFLYPTVGYHPSEANQIVDVDLLELEKVPLTSEGQDSGYIQNPKIEERGFSQEVALKSGETLVLSGYERVDTQSSKHGLGTVNNNILGGDQLVDKTRTILVILLTPVVLESPLLPESRMNY